jgi:hypothetical protein
MKSTPSGRVGERPAGAKKARRAAKLPPGSRVTKKKERNV